MTGNETNTEGRGYSLPLICCWERARTEEAETKPRLQYHPERIWCPSEKCLSRCPLRCFGNVCMCWLHCSTAWFECAFSSAVQPSEQWISWLQRNRKKRRKGTGAINGLSPIPSCSSSRWKGQRQMHTVKLLSAWNMMFSWGNWSRSVTTLFSDRNTAMCACETDEWGEKE